MITAVHLIPLILFKMMFIGYLFGIHSERKVEKEIKMIIAYHWFLSLKFYDPVPYLNRLDRQVQWFGFKVEAVALDSGYLTNPKGLSNRNIFGVIAHSRFHPTTGLFPNWKFTLTMNGIFTFVLIPKNYPTRQQTESV